MKASSTLRKAQEAPTAKRVIDLTAAELVEALAERMPDVLIAYLEGSIKPPPELMTRAECAELLRISTAQLDLLSRRDVDPIPFEVVGDSRRYVRTDVHSWVRRQKGRAT